MKAQILEVSGGVAEVVLDDQLWDAAVSASVELDGGLFSRVSSAWIDLDGTYHAWVDPAYLSASGVKRAVNSALLEHYMPEPEGVQNV